MMGRNKTVIGIDVGGERKGFHAVVLCDGKFTEKITDTNPQNIVDWCLKHQAATVAVDAPCGWSTTGKSRAAERELAQKRIFSFSTPHYERALQGNFYKWVLNGMELYQLLKDAGYPLFDGNAPTGNCCIETFPHAVVCELARLGEPRIPKSKVRRAVLKKQVYDISMLTNIDFVDAALCSLAAESFRKDSYKSYGTREEGFIVVPRLI